MGGDVSSTLSRGSRMIHGAQPLPAKQQSIRNNIPTQVCFQKELEGRVEL